MLAVGFGVVLALISIALGAELVGWEVVFLVFESLLVGLLFNAARNQGAWLVDDGIVLETAFGRLTFPLDRVVAVHGDDPLTTLGVATADRYVVMSAGSPVGPRDPMGTVEDVHAILEARRIRAVWHSNAAAVRAARLSFAPWHSARAILDTLRRPLVVGSVAGGVLVAVAVAMRA